LGGIQAIYSVDPNFKLYMLAIYTWSRHHSLGFFISEMPFDATFFGGVLEGVETGINMRPVPFRCIFRVFIVPFFLDFIIVFAILFRTLLELFSPPFFVISFFFLKFVVFSAPFRFGVVFFPFDPTLGACRAFTTFFIYKFLHGLRCATAVGTFFKFLHPTIMVGFFFNAKSCDATLGAKARRSGDPFLDFNI
jgi:hypothetical protein